jgi:hypothetical protein
MSEQRSRTGFAKQAVSLALCGMLCTLPLSADGNHGVPTTTPIKHIVVIFQENRSFDQYFATSRMLPIYLVRLRSTHDGLRRGSMASRVRDC